MLEGSDEKNIRQFAQEILFISETYLEGHVFEDPEP